MQSFDIVIVGAGMVGLTMAAALGDSDLRVAVVDAQAAPTAPEGAPELRVSALNLASQRLFERLQVWPRINADRVRAYQGMFVWEQDSFAKIDFNHRQVQQPQLGYIAENANLRFALWQRVQQCRNVQVFCEQSISNLVFGERESFVHLASGDMLGAALIVGADGANSMVRSKANLPLTFWDYEQRALVATVRTELPHDNVARQIFTPQGPLAFLPLYEDNLCSIVWSQDPEPAENVAQLDDTAFANALTAAFDGRLGRCALQSPRQSYPLKMRYARQWVKDRVALVGDAAHTIHPLAGQGANLGFMDVAALSETVLALHAQGKDIGLHDNLRAYERWRKAEAAKMAATMEGFKRLFGGENPLKKLVRGIGMRAADSLPGVKNEIIRQAMGLDGELPDLAK